MKNEVNLLLSHGKENDFPSIFKNDVFERSLICVQLLSKQEILPNVHGLLYSY